MPKIRLLITDRHRIVRQGLQRLLAEQEDMEVVAEAGQHAEVLAAVREHEVDVVVLDLSLPGRDGVETVARLRDLLPALKIIVTKLDGDDVHVARAIRAGADGFISKDHAAEELATVIRQLVRGGICLCPSRSVCLAMADRDPDPDAALHARLSNREYKIFQMLVTGMRGVEIARELCLSSKTVSTHKSNVLRKLNLERTGDLYEYALKHQLVAS